MLININFEKSITQGKQFKGPLGRHGAIRQRKEEVFEQHGHQFVQKQFYNIMCCALCGGFYVILGFNVKIVNSCVIKNVTKRLLPNVFPNQGPIMMQLS